MFFDDPGYWLKVQRDANSGARPFVLTPELLEGVDEVFPKDAGMRNVARSNAAVFGYLLDSMARNQSIVTPETMLKLLNADEAAKNEARPILERAVAIRALCSKVTEHYIVGKLSEPI